MVTLASKIKFIAPFTVWRGGQTFYRAKVNGEWHEVDAVPGSWKLLNQRFKEARDADRKAKAAARRAKARARASANGRAAND